MKRSLIYFSIIKIFFFFIQLFRLIQFIIFISHFRSFIFSPLFVRFDYFLFRLLKFERIFHYSLPGDTKTGTKKFFARILVTKNTTGNFTHSL